MAYLTIPLLQLHLDGIIYHQPVPNTVMDNSKFMRVGYSNADLTLNGIHIRITGVVPSSTNTRGRPHCTFKYEQNQQWIEPLIQLEQAILARVDERERTFRLRDQIIGGHISLNDGRALTTFTSMILKVSGVWITARSLRNHV